MTPDEPTNATTNAEGPNLADGPPFGFMHARVAFYVDDDDQERIVYVAVRRL